MSNNNKEFTRKFTEQELIRREKYKKLVEEKQDPFIVAKYERNIDITEVKKQFSSLTKEELESKSEIKLKLTGRIRQFREAGKKAIFANIQDQDDSIQIYVREDELGSDLFSSFSDLDLGDIIGVTGVAMKTNHGELTIRVKSYQLLTKSLRPLPDNYYGLNDIEEKYRRRYVDLIINSETKKIFIARSKIIRIIQKILDDKGMYEVETPILQSVHGGAIAKPFKSYYNALERDFYLRIATELPLKRLIVGGFNGVYEIGRLFRNEGMDTRHNPEFTTIEVYVAYEDMFYHMDLTESIFKQIALEINGTTQLSYGGHELDLSKPFKRWHMVDAIKEICGVDFWQEMTYEQAFELAKQHNVDVEKHHYGVGHIINSFFEKYVEDKIIEPTFITGHPVEVSPLAKRNAKDSRFTDRFELFIVGREYANAYSELNNPIDQYDRFLEQLKEADSGNDEAQEMDIDFVEALEYGLPPTAGLGIGIDRTVMLITGQESIKDVILFPQMKPRG
ncbi:lysine--tRNA ligase [Spiroplasma endosymbiont of Labia minor]|uniref:lysine--tRNA ligase n=1 Tax=Spiroplasma endosymbiont of Labia minor TaxID=3066305 RepID=UPI0030D62BA8